MCCVISSLFFIGPRAALIIWWLINPGRLNLAFPNFFMLLAGTVFLPLTTLAYVMISPGGVAGLDILWLGIAIILDLGAYGGGVFSRRKR